MRQVYPGPPIDPNVCPKCGKPRDPAKKHQCLADRLMWLGIGAAFGIPLLSCGGCLGLLALPQEVQMRFGEFMIWLLMISLAAIPVGLVVWFISCVVRAIQRP